MENILSLATELGQRIARHERYVQLRAAEDAADADQETKDLLAAFEAQRKKMADLEAKQQPIEPNDKHELQRLDNAVHASQSLQRLAKAQADYMELMNRVNAAIRKELDGSPQS